MKIRLYEEENWPLLSESVYEWREEFDAPDALVEEWRQVKRRYEELNDQLLRVTTRKPRPGEIEDPFHYFIEGVY